MGCGCLGSCGPGSTGFVESIHFTEHAINSNIYPTSNWQDVPFGSFHPGGAHFVFADGHVEFLSDTINMTTYQALSTIAGGELISSY